MKKAANINVRDPSLENSLKEDLKDKIMYTTNVERIRKNKNTNKRNSNTK